MRISSIALTNFRAFKELPETELGAINVLVGPNNAGKSSVIKALYSLQAGTPLSAADVYLGEASSEISLGVTGVTDGDAFPEDGIFTAVLRANNNNVAKNLRKSRGNVSNIEARSRRPDHFVVPFLAKRKAVSYQENVSSANAMNVGADFSYLSANLSRISNASFPGGQRYIDACREILGFIVTAIPSLNGQVPGIYLEDGTTLPLSELGEGVPNIAGFLAELVFSERKLFLIEELENDLHPQALKALLDLILEKSQTNQFVISTHSNIVVKHLGGAPGAKVFRVSQVAGTPVPTATMEEVTNTPEARLKLLRELGYDLADFDLNEGWLVLEEASAERIVRDYLIPWFAPKLTRIRTVSTRGVDRVNPFFDDLYRLVLYMHLEDRYREKCWVRVDGDDVGQDAVAKLREKYPSWPEEHFATFSEGQFEKYYPVRFQPQVEATLAIVDKEERREAKKALLLDAVEWLDANPDEGKAALEEAAADVIADLREMEAAF